MKEENKLEKAVEVFDKKPLTKNDVAEILKCLSGKADEIKGELYKIMYGGQEALDAYTLTEVKNMYIRAKDLRLALLDLQDSLGVLLLEQEYAKKQLAAAKAKAKEKAAKK